MQAGENETAVDNSSCVQADASLARIIRLDLNEQEAVAAAALFDVAVKAAGLQVAQAALHLTHRLKAATAAAYPAAEG